MHKLNTLWCGHLRRRVILNMHEVVVSLPNQGTHDIACYVAFVYLPIKIFGKTLNLIRFLKQVISLYSQSIFLKLLLLLAQVAHQVVHVHRPRLLLANCIIILQKLIQKWLGRTSNFRLRWRLFATWIIIIECSIWSVKSAGLPKSLGLRFFQGGVGCDADVIVRSLMIRHNFNMTSL